jgi:hypothetical protein
VLDGGYNHLSITEFDSILMLMASNQFLMDCMFRPFFVGRMANNAPSRRVVSEARVSASIL